ncbi:beta-lactamase family protein [Chryseobacterium formosus]|uniref:Beta-lactamase family protein n=1 Tax=Chryseobacterium formosus TaxID=1537363 RepID=A0ABT3XQS2_9FLAO|nr:serine hydrolase [Chryseobacterium formosus]MCX8523877.1 beta-lactamase family protein [Chryseobacterium formosus]
MKKVFLGIIAGSTAIAGIIYLSGYGYIFKAIGINLKKGPLTPSIDDVEKFPSNIISNSKPQPWKKSAEYNSKKISERLENELKKTRASSLIVIKDNTLVHEQYWKDHDYSSLMNSFSMSKGFLSILVGCAIDDGFLDSENELISSVFPQYKESKFGKHLTFRHLMTMQGGFDWDEEYRHPFAENSKQYFVEDLAKQTFETEINKMPGINYEYQSVSAQLLGLAIVKITGKSLASYLSEKLWIPLGMEFPAKWSTDEKGTEKAFCCIHATARDLAKIGQLILQNGNWNGKQLLNSDYYKRMLNPTKENEAFCYTIWANDETSSTTRFFYGFLGQFIIILPEKNMVIVKTGFYNRLEVDKKKRPLQVQILIDELEGLY